MNESDLRSDVHYLGSSENVKYTLPVKLKDKTSNRKKRP